MFPRFDQFVDNKLSIHLGEDKTKTILFSTKYRKKKVGTLDTDYGDIKNQAICQGLGYELDKDLPGKAMAQKVINKVNSMLKLPQQEKRILITIPEMAFLQCYKSTKF